MSRSERELVRAATVDSIARERLRQELLPHCIRATKEYIQKRAIPRGRTEELVGIGMSCFDHAFNVYMKNMHHLTESREGHFFDYYIWWMRQAITKHLQIPSDDHRLEPPQTNFHA